MMSMTGEQCTNITEGTPSFIKYWTRQTISLFLTLEVKEGPFLLYTHLHSPQTKSNECFRHKQGRRGSWDGVEDDNQHTDCCAYVVLCWHLIWLFSSVFTCPIHLVLPDRVLLILLMVAITTSMWIYFSYDIVTSIWLITVRKFVRGMISRGERRWNRTSPDGHLLWSHWGNLHSDFSWKIPFQRLPLELWSCLTLGENPVTQPKTLPRL